LSTGGVESTLRGLNDHINDVLPALSDHLKQTYLPLSDDHVNDNTLPIYVIPGKSDALHVASGDSEYSLSNKFRSVIVAATVSHEAGADQILSVIVITGGVISILIGLAVPVYEILPTVSDHLKQTYLPLFHGVV
jgi:hypothetical protein